MTYYFDLVEGGETVRDEEGRPCATLEDALGKAAAELRSIVSADILAGRFNPKSCIVVRRDGAEAARVTFNEAVVAV